MATVPSNNHLVTKFVTENCSITWTIENFGFCKLKSCFESRIFLSENGYLKWVLRVHPLTFPDGTHMSVDLVHKNKTAKLELVKYRLSMRNANNTWNYEQSSKIATFSNPCNDSMSTCPIFTGTSKIAFPDSANKVHVTLKVFIAAHLRTVESYDVPGLISETQQLKIGGEIHSKLLEKRCAEFREMLLEKNFTDVTIIIGSKEIAAHQIVLAAGSPVFKSMLKNDTLERDTKRIDIVDFDFKIVNELVQFIYSGKMPDFKTLDLGTVFNILKAADKYAVDELRQLIVNFLRSNLDPKNVVDVLALADMHSVGELKKDAIQFISENSAII